MPTFLQLTNREIHGVKYSLAPVKVKIKRGDKSDPPDHKVNLLTVACED